MRKERQRDRQRERERERDRQTESWRGTERVSGKTVRVWEREKARVRERERERERERISSKECSNANKDMLLRQLISTAVSQSWNLFMHLLRSQNLVRLDERAFRRQRKTDKCFLISNFIEQKCFESAKTLTTCATWPIFSCQRCLIKSCPYANSSTRVF